MTMRSARTWRGAMAVLSAMIQSLVMVSSARVPRCSLFDAHQRQLVGEAAGPDAMALSRDVGVAHAVAAARDGPALEFLGLGIEAHHGIRGGLGFAVPDDILDGGDSVGRRL